MVATIPPSGPNGPPSTHARSPGTYCTAGIRKGNPLTGASNTSDRPAFQPKWSPQQSGIPPGEKNANDSHAPARNTLTSAKPATSGLAACATAKTAERTTSAATGPTLSARRRSA